MIQTDPQSAPPAAKPHLTTLQRALRLLGSALDPRAWAHLVRMVNYYNTTHVRPRRALTLGKGVRIAPNASFSNAERIFIGDHSHIGARCTLWAGYASGRIVLGRNTLLGPDVLMTAANYRFNDGAPVTRQPMKEADVILGEDVWVGAHCVILPGTTIGDGAIIGAGSVVRGDIPARAIIAPPPVRQIGARRDPG